jgi:hypothetical protein
MGKKNTTNRESRRAWRIEHLPNISERKRKTNGQRTVMKHVSTSIVSSVDADKQKEFH